MKERKFNVRLVGLPIRFPDTLAIKRKVEEIDRLRPDTVEGNAL